MNGLTEDQRLLRNLKDAGCSPATVDAVCALCAAGCTAEAVAALRRHRCRLMDALHQSQEKVDRLDYLLRQLERAPKDPPTKHNRKG